MLDGRKLKYLRLLKGYSKKHLAETIGISERWATKIENEGAIPSEEVYQKWLDVLYGKIPLLDRPPKKNGRPPKVKNDEL
jgi:transcriptional regulator with XRE-family HTH domain